MAKFLIVGSGFAGAVLAEQLSKNPDHQITVIDERNHIGGNCYTKKDKQTGTNEHIYGPHIFHTSNEEVWNYINQFVKMMPYTNRVKTNFNNQIFSMPINLHTINQFFQKDFNPSQAREFFKTIGEDIENPQNFEEQGLSLLGKELYYAFFHSYTKKQWGVQPSKLSANILKRLPVRFNYDDNYYNDKYQGIPENGYTEIFEKMLSASNIAVKTDTKYQHEWEKDFDHIFYSGPIDGFFDHKYGTLSYRTVYFEKEYHPETDDYQGNAVINYPESKYHFTRIAEHKHFEPWNKTETTFIVKEFSKETEVEDVPFYPKRLENDMILLEKYQSEASRLEKITFIGRLGQYKYMDMHHVIEESLNLAKKFI